MKNVLVGMSILMVMVAVTNAAVIPGVTATATDYYVTEWDSLTLAAVNGDPNNVVDGSGFEEQLGYHYNHGFRGWIYNESGDPTQLNGQGTMWIASMDIDDQGTKPSITFNLRTAQTLTGIKVWNFNHANESFIKGFGSPVSRLGVNRLNMGVQTMDIVLLADNGTTVLATFEDVDLNKAPGRDDVDFGQSIDIAALNGGAPVTGVRYVRFDIQSNYGDAAGQVGLSEVRFYNDVDVTLDAGDDQTVWMTDPGTGEPSAIVTLDATTTATSTTWFAYPQVGPPFDADDPNDVVIADVNAVDTTVTIKAPGVYYFTLIDDDNYSFGFTGPMGNFSGVYDTVKIRVLESETDDGLIGYWPLNGNLDDASGNSHNGSFTGSPTPVYENTEGISEGKSVRFNRIGSVQITDPDIDPGSDAEGAFYPYFLGQMSREFTISLWCKVDGSFPTDEQTMGLFERGNMRMWLVGDAISFGLTVQPLSSNEYFGALEGMGTTKVTDGNWHFVALTYDGFSVKLYVDGRLDGEVLQYGTEVYSGSGGTVRIGARSGETLSFVGLIDDVKLYRLAKDQQEIVDAYKAVNAAFKPCVTLYEGDMNGDCQADINDLLMLANNWLQ